MFGGLRAGIGFSHELGKIADAHTTLATDILAGLEFVIASDIRHTVITREFSDLQFVDSLVPIRTAFSLFHRTEVEALRTE